MTHTAALLLSAVYIASCNSENVESDSAAKSINLEDYPEFSLRTVQTTSALLNADNTSSFPRENATLADDGLLVDSWTIQSRPGASVKVVLVSEAFDPVIRVIDTSGNELSRNDNEGLDSLNARATFTVPDDGQALILVSGENSRSTGPYTLLADGPEPLPEQEDDAPAKEMADPILSESDLVLTLGMPTERILSEDTATVENADNLTDRWTVYAEPGDVLSIAMLSDEFDTSLQVQDALGQLLAENDDMSDFTYNSALSLITPESGRIDLLASTVDSDTEATYTLVAQVGPPSRLTEYVDFQGNPPPAPGRALTLDEVVTETLTDSNSDGSTIAANDETFTGHYWTLIGKPGFRVSAYLSSTDFDSYLVARNSLGKNLVYNDDFSGDTLDSGFDIVFPADGRLDFIVTSVSETSTGQYTLTATTSDYVPPNFNTAEAARPSDVLALVIGVADYPGTGNDLPKVAEDAEMFTNFLLEDLRVRPENVLTLTDEDATRANIEKAFTDHLSRATDEGSVILYYSGHGVDVEDNLFLTDIEDDGSDEALFVYDGLLLDDELAFLMEGLKAKQVLVAFDSCFSGTGLRNSDPAEKVRMIKDLKSQDASIVPSKFLGEGSEFVTRRMENQGRTLDLTHLDKTVFLSASTEDQVAWVAPDPIRGSVFTNFLLEELRTSLSMNSSFTEVIGNVSERTQDFVLSAYDIEQTPEIEGGLKDITISAFAEK